MTQSQFASLHSITIGTVKRWWKKGYLVGNKAINGRVSLTGSFTDLGSKVLLGFISSSEQKQMTSFREERRGSFEMAREVRRVAGQLMGLADKLEEEGHTGRDK